MTIRNTWPVQVADGDELAEGFFNGNTDNSGIRRNASSEDTTEYSAIGATSYTDIGYSKTFTPPAGVNSCIKAVKVVLDAKYVTQNGFIRGTLTNDTNSATINLTSAVLTTVNGNDDTYWLSVGDVAYTEATLYAETLGVTGLSGGKSSLTSPKAICGGATYTLTFRAARSGSSTAADIYIKDITVTIYWEYLHDVVVSGWA